MTVPRTRQPHPGGKLVMLVCAMLSASAAAAAATAPVAVNAARRDGAADIVLTWPAPVRMVSLQVEGATLSLRFDRPLGEAPMDALPGQLTGWVKGVRYGYDSLLIEAARPVHYSVSGAGNTVTITLTAAPGPAQAATGAVGADARRIDRLRALTMLEQGELDAAAALLKALALDAPRDATLASDLARVAEARGDWRGALNGYTRAASLPGEYEPARQAAARLRRLHGPSVSVSTTLRDVNRADRQTITTVEGRTLWDRRNLAGFRVEDRHLEIDAVRRANGVIGPVDRHLASAELWLGYNWAGGGESRVGLLANPDGSGFHLYHRSGGDIWTELEAEYRRPYFAYVEGIADDAVRDRLLLRNHGPVGPHIDTSLGFSANHYFVAGFDAGDSAGVDASLRYRPRDGLQFSYALDAEFVDDVGFAPAPGGGTFAPLPITDRQVHALGVALSGEGAPGLRWGAGGGFAWDIYNDNGAFADLNMAWRLAPGLELTLRAARAISTERGQGNRVHQLGALLTWRPVTDNWGETP